jgi:hypothetical protein
MVAEVAAGHASLGEQSYERQLEERPQAKGTEEKLLGSLDGRADGLSGGKGDHRLWRKGYHKPDAMQQAIARGR